MKTLSVVTTYRVLGEDFLAGTTVTVEDDEKAARLLAFRAQVGAQVVSVFREAAPAAAPAAPAGGASASGEQDDDSSAQAPGPVIDVASLADKSYTEIVKAARDLGLEVPANTKKADVLEAIAAYAVRAAGGAAGSEE